MRTIDKLVASKRPATMRERLERDVFKRPWWWLGLTRERWLDTPFEERVGLFVPFYRER